ncbi:uncharacterized protein TrAtP1_005767 [Trichoderma atroviride]|uniref:Early meiotic induction protein 1 n=1 Tax=Hypocrea atroviridis (strain ATCC 20476 / IMI 206040) TaxID=452589 RepID=G9NSB3_HYPAI|nr:uncharacterized protein TRIATDRAFT_218178 [Trichoderma atroviride IMI 206040]EHK46314.1 hypothetical protein TRIATDRAFT_218178 [Trichoderma atroviride IMI 206040]UKZ64552.1 hypothetical protein TrAtP1_005767 [Trichoderma atroviride]
MGWLWTSLPPKPPADQPSSSPSSASPLPPASSSSIPSSSQAPNEPVDPEIQKLLDLFNKSDDTPKSSSSSSSNQPPSAVTSWLSSKFSSAPEALPVPPLDPVSESLLPTDMSCRQAFDQAWSCNSLGGQWNAVYRNGEMRSCSHLWDDFWFCMRTKSFSGTIKENAVREHYRRKEYEKYYAPGSHSSEEIWEAREHKVAPGSAFSEAIEIAQVDDDEWRRLEDERRRKIRQDLGYEKKS